MSLQGGGETHSDLPPVKAKKKKNYNHPKGVKGDFPTREVEERVEDVESVGVVSLDELVGVVVLDFLPAMHKHRSVHRTPWQRRETRGSREFLPLEEAEAVTADQNVAI